MRCLHWITIKMPNLSCVNWPHFAVDIRSFATVNMMEKNNIGPIIPISSKCDIDFSCTYPQSTDIVYYYVK